LFFALAILCDFNIFTKELIAMSLRLMVEGCSIKVTEFLDQLRAVAPKYRFYDRSKWTTSTTESRVEYYFDENPCSKMQVSERVSKLEIVTKDNTTIEIILLDPIIVDMGNGNTYIHGKNYDIFASGEKENDL
jgi:hypothetical protein